MELAKLSPELEGKITNLEQVTLFVKNPEEREEAIYNIKVIKSMKVFILEFFKESKESAYKTWKAIVSNEKTFTDRLDTVEKKVKQVVLVYDNEQEEKRRKEQARLQAIEDERVRKEQERLMKRADKLKSPERSEVLMEEAASIVAPVIQVAEKEKAKGESTRKIWKGRVTNPKKVNRIFMVIDQGIINNYAKATKGAIPQEGIEFYEESSLAIKI